jgi:hypothetical protein
MNNSGLLHQTIDSEAISKIFFFWVFWWGCAPTKTPFLIRSWGQIALMRLP